MKSGLAITLSGPMSLETLKTHINAASYALRAHLSAKGIDVSECEITVEIQENHRVVVFYDSNNIPRRNALPVISLPSSFQQPEEIE